MLKNWYAIYVNVRHEKKVAEKLCELNIEAYAPVAKKQQKTALNKPRLKVTLMEAYLLKHNQNFA